MDIVAVSSSSFTGESMATEIETVPFLPPDEDATTLIHKPRDPAGGAVTYTDICCQRYVRISGSLLLKTTNKLL
jgi:hypothetical protein